MKARRILLAVVGLIPCGLIPCGLIPCAAQAADWPQWRGPQRNGVSQETGLLKQWPKDGPKLVWQANGLGGGYSTPAVVGDRVYILENEGTDDEFVRALDARDGRVVWSARLGKVGPNNGPKYPGARSTPTVDGDVLYALGSDGDLACVETTGGKIRWTKNLRTDFGGKTGNWAYAESPLVDGNALVVTPGGSEATLVALDKKSGNPIWKAALAEGDEAAYSSVVIGEFGGVKQYVQFLQKGLVGLDAETGKELWRYAKTAQGSPANIPTPVVHDDYVYSSTGRGGGGLVKIEKAGDGFKATEVYAGADLPKAIGGAVVVGDELYGTSQSLLCVDFLKGTIKWQDRSIGAASVLYADGNLYLHGEGGDVALVEASPEGYHEKGRFTPPDQPQRTGKAWAYPVVANGRLYIADYGTLWCYDIRDVKTAGAR
jgi:outer membrane protein assembly factor BamB